VESNLIGPVPPADGSASRPSSGELAEQKHLVDVLDHSFEGLAPRTAPGLPPNTVMRGGDGSLWRTAGTSASGEQLYVLDGVDPDTCPRWVKEPEAELIALVGGLTLVEPDAEVPA
jgi:hypothetical protein